MLHWFLLEVRKGNCVMDQDLFRGKLVHLVALDTDELAKSYSRWSRNSEYNRLAGSQPTVPFSVKAVSKWIDENLEKETARNYFFAIRTLAEERFIGDIGLDGINWTHGESFVGIGIGDHEAWGKGYGTDAMHILLRFAFEELNMHRVALNTFEYNPRAIRSYEKVGFQHEGHLRGFLNREGRRWDVWYMGILQEEWRQNNGNNDRPST